jgi:hypothetical protein
MPCRPKTPIDRQLDYILSKALGGARGTTQGWKVLRTEKHESIEPNSGRLNFEVNLHFKKAGGHVNNLEATERQWRHILEVIQKAGSSSKFNSYPWIIQNTADIELAINDASNAIPDVQAEPLPRGVRASVIPSDIKRVEDLSIPEELLQPGSISDELIEGHPAFTGLFDRNKQIRIILSAIRAFRESEGFQASHLILYGPTACGKTLSLEGIIRLLGDGSILKLDATRTTRAGLESLIFKELTEVPPIIIMEEIEKANEEALLMWLGAMDDRREFRCVNFRTRMVRQVKFLGIATANDIEKFHAMMGDKSHKPGALSSRFKHQLYYPRPDEKVLRRILIRDIPKVNGDFAWVEPCIELARTLKTNDPRRVLAFLDGRERLLTGEYQKDILAVYGQNEEL